MDPIALGIAFHRGTTRVRVDWSDFIVWVLVRHLRHRLSEVATIRRRAMDRNEFGPIRRIGSQGMQVVWTGSQMIVWSVL